MNTTVEGTMRTITDAQGRAWQPVAVDSMVAHMKRGATLAFRAADDPAAEPIRSHIQFNSHRAAELALRTMSEKDMRRRLEWAKTDAGVV